MGAAMTPKPPDDATRIAAFLRLLFRPGDVFEVRVLDGERPGYRRPHVESGYFDYEHIEEVPRSLAGITASRGAFVIPNPVNPALLARAVNRLRPVGQEPTTSDADILARRWLLLDFDAVRPAGISSTDAEHQAALARATEVRDWLVSLGWPEPITVDSGNGAQALYRVDLPVDDGGLVQRCLAALAAAVDDGTVRLDQAVHNPARIWRLPGTWNRKGDSMPDRPHRMAMVIAAPDALQAAPRALLEEFAQAPALPAGTPQGTPTAPVTADGGRPGDDYNRRGEIGRVLEVHGWQRVGEANGNQLWRRPGKASGNHSATFDGCTFYVFSSAAPPFEANRGYSPFAVFALLEHGGDFVAAAAALAAHGYGVAPPSEGVDISGILRMCGTTISPEEGSRLPPCASAPAGPASCPGGDTAAALAAFQPRTLIERLAEGCALNPPVVHGALREGETMNIIASPKVGKSWLASSLAISVASGVDWLGFPVELGPVLHIDNELHANTSTHRYRRLADAMGLQPHLFGHNLTLVNLRGRLTDIRRLGALFDAYPPGAFRLVIIDAFYRAMPKGTDENDNGTIAELYNLIDLYAMRLGCAFVLVHHTSKGTQSGKTVTDVGAGAGSQSRAVDTHMVLRQHEADNLVVLEAAARSWPPIRPIALEWNWPLFTPVAEVDTSALLGAVRSGAQRKTGPTLEEFVESCVGRQDPCSERAVVYQAEQAFGMTRRGAEDLLALAKEKGLVEKIKADGAHMKYVRVRAGLAGEKAQWVAAMLVNSPGVGIAEIARRAEVTERYVRDVRQQLTDVPGVQQGT